MSVLIALTMVFSFAVAFLPQPEQPETVVPTATRVLLPSATPTPEPSPSATVPIGPLPPTSTPTITPTLTATPAAAAGKPALRAAATPQAESSALDSDVTFAVTGDSRQNGEQYRKLLASVAASDSEFLINTGDLVNAGTEAQWQVFEKTMAGFDLPFYPVPGNHDGLDGKLDGYLQHSGAPAAHYSFDRGPVHLTLADSHNGGLTARELEWIRQDLSACSQPVKMVFVHHPPFDPDGSDHIMAFGNEEMMALMVEQDVDHVFAGHIHAYSSANRDGVLYTITGGGGAPLYTSGHPEAFYHWLRVSVHGEQVSIEVVKV